MNININIGVGTNIKSVCEGGGLKCVSAPTFG